MLDPHLYHSVREREGRLYPDSVVTSLPAVPAAHPHRREWRSRSVSAARLTGYVTRMPKPIVLLDLGCGNGWLTNRLARIPGVRAVGVDFRNEVELTQAARVFSDANGLTFLDADIREAPFAPACVDLIVLASAAQYFPDLPGLIRGLARLLTPHGEIHILDSPLYSADGVEAARVRSREYYASLGVPTMAGYYHHHPAAALREFRPEWLHAPGALWPRMKARLGLPESPFPWIRIRPHRDA